MNFKFHVLLILPFFWAINSLHAQKNKQKDSIQLRDLFVVLEKKHEIKFSYNDKLIKNKFVENSFIKLPLNKVLDKIAINFKLRFEKITERYITVSKSGKLYQISGNIFDKKDKKPIQGASVVSLRRNKGVISNENGFFKLSNLIEGDKVEVSFIGYDTKTLIVNEELTSEQLSLILSESTTLLEEVLVSDYMVGGIDKKTDGSLVISPKKLGTVSGLTEPDILQSVQLLPGINSPDETASGLFIRGGTPEQNLILFDGIKMYNSSHFFGMISAFNPYIVDKVKVFKSGASAEYGNHTSGVIDIETNKEIPKSFNGGFGVNMTHFDAFMNIPISKKIGISLSGRRSFTDVFKTNTFNRLSKKVFQNSIISRNESVGTELYDSKNDFYFFDVNSKLTYKPSSKDIITFNYLLVRNKLNYVFNTKNSNRYITEDDLQIKNTGIRTMWERKLGNNSILRTNFYSSTYDLNYEYNGSFDYGSPYTQKALKSNIIKDLGFKSVFEKKLNEKSSFLTGYEFSNNSVSYSIERGVKSTISSTKYKIADSGNNNSHAWFFNYGFNNYKKTIVNVGVRTNYFTLSDKVYFAPRIYFQQQLLPNLSFKTSFEFKQQNIGRLLEVHTSDFGLENEVWLLIDNEELPILRNKQYTFGAIYKANGLTFDIDYYRKYSKGVTSATKATEGNIRGFYQGTSKVDGVDVLLKKSINNYNTWVNFSYSKSRYIFDEVNNGKFFSTNFDTTNSFLWAHNLNLGNFSFSLAWVWKTGTPYSPVERIENNGNLVLGDLNSKRLPAYHKMDLSSSYSFNFDKNKKWKGKIGISLLNLYDRTNYLRRSYSSVWDGTKYSIQQSEQLSLGMTPNLVLRIFIK
ncbi:TonB-dependent receptor [uncultured Tenacibaculum sp.]|uniref:TonB-dependent receptor n=1 Tax=uncultured Tenacibaculum sp. TaxID=174713 RepID=UPI00261FA5BD|nr:TonB-dependent receptor [uncultured Tenacibaculum sp.]